MKEICGANVTGLSLGSTEVEFHPGYFLRGAEYTAEAGAGFVQTITESFSCIHIDLPLSLFSQERGSFTSNRFASGIFLRSARYFESVGRYKL